MLDETLRSAARRYRLPATPSIVSQGSERGAAETLAIVIERARTAMANNEPPDSATKRIFIDSLGTMIEKALHAKHGDMAFQALVLRHRSASVREYASLYAHARQDRRQIYALVNAIAHPARQQRMTASLQREGLARLHACACSEYWAELANIARDVLLIPEIGKEASLAHGLNRLLDSSALSRLLRLDVLTNNHRVRQYIALRDKHGSRSECPDATANGSAARQRGAAVEMAAAKALWKLADHLNEKEGAGAQYRVVTSLRVPASIPANPARAKTEWDAVLLRKTAALDPSQVWNVCLLLEAKASVDAATTDLPRLLRGLRLLAHAGSDRVYTFESQQGSVRLHGESLSALMTEASGLSRTVLYCTDAPAEDHPRLLSAASRMRLLSAPASLTFAGVLGKQGHADIQSLEPVWRQLLESPSWRAVLNQYPALHQVRELMVHIDDLLAAIEQMEG